jgi:hypothetical protein
MHPTNTVDQSAWNPVSQKFSIAPSLMLQVAGRAWGVLSEVQTLVCGKNIHDRAYLSIGVTSGIGAGLCRVPGDGCFQGYRGEAMQDLGYELPRNPIPGTSVNKVYRLPLQAAVGG